MHIQFPDAFVFLSAAKGLVIHRGMCNNWLVLVLSCLLFVCFKVVGLS